MDHLLDIVSSTIMVHMVSFVTTFKIWRKKIPQK